MRYYRLQLSQSLDAALHHRASTCPAFGSPGYARMKDIRQGNLIFLCEGLFKVRAIAVATSDAYEGNVSYFNKNPEITDKPMRTVDFKILRRDLDVNTSDLEKFLNAKSFHSQCFCVELYPLDEPGFRALVNSILT